MDECAKHPFTLQNGLLLLAVVAIGFTRLEDRIGVPGPAGNAMAAMAIPPSDETDDGSCR